MRAVIQRVMKASVSVGDELVSSIGRGVCVLIGISRDDTKKDMEYMVRKLLKLRVFDNKDGKRWSESVVDKNFEILCVSQFTLYCTLKGNKPDYHLAMGGEQSQQFYNEFLDQLRQAYKPELIKDGSFGAYMQVSIQNDGPVTITLDSPAVEQPAKQKGGQQSGNKKEVSSAKPSVTSSASSSTAAAEADPTEAQLANDVQDKVKL